MCVCVLCGNRHLDGNQRHPGPEITPGHHRQTDGQWMSSGEESVCESWNDRRDGDIGSRNQA